MDINISKLSDKEISDICLKYNIIHANELKNYTRKDVIQEIQSWCKYKKENYKQNRQRRNSSPNIVSSVNTKNITPKPNIKRTKSAPLNIQKTKLI